MTLAEYDAYRNEYDAAGDESKFSNRGDKFELLNRFRERGLGNLPPASSTLWMLLWSFCDEGGKVTISDNRLAHYLNKKPDTVKQQRKELMKAGYLVRTDGGYRGSASTYVLMCCPLGVDARPVDLKKQRDSRKGGKVGV